VWRRARRNLLAKNPDLAFATAGVSTRPEDEPYPLRFARHQYEAMQQGTLAPNTTAVLFVQFVNAVGLQLRVRECVGGLCADRQA
jgi:hypothetical protein